VKNVLISHELLSPSATHKVGVFSSRVLSTLTALLTYAWRHVYAMYYSV